MRATAASPSVPGTPTSKSRRRATLAAGSFSGRREGSELLRPPALSLSSRDLSSKPPLSASASSVRGSESSDPQRQRVRVVIGSTAHEFSILSRSISLASASDNFESLTQQIGQKLKWTRPIVLLVKGRMVDNSESWDHVAGGLSEAVIDADLLLLPGLSSALRTRFGAAVAACQAADEHSTGFLDEEKLRLIMRRYVQVDAREMAIAVECMPVTAVSEDGSINYMDFLRKYGDPVERLRCCSSNDSTASPVLSSGLRSIASFRINIEDSLGRVRHVVLSPDSDWKEWLSATKKLFGAPCGVSYVDPIAISGDGVLHVTDEISFEALLDSMEASAHLSGESNAEADCSQLPLPLTASSPHKEYLNQLDARMKKGSPVKEMDELLAVRRGNILTGGNSADWPTEFPLHAAAEAGSTVKCEALLGSGQASCSQRDGMGRTALHYATLRSRPAAVSTLLENGADPSAYDDTGVTPLHTACKRGDVDSAQLLLQAGGNASATDNSFATPLHEAATAGSKQIVLALLKAGGDPFAKRNDGKTPLDLTKFPDIRSLLALSSGHGNQTVANDRSSQRRQTGSLLLERAAISVNACSTALSALMQESTRLAPARAAAIEASAASLSVLCNRVKTLS